MSTSPTLSISPSVTLSSTPSSGLSATSSHSVTPSFTPSLSSSSSASISITPSITPSLLVLPSESPSAYISGSVSVSSSTPTPTPKQTTKTPTPSINSVPATTKPFEDEDGDTVVVDYCTDPSYPYGYHILLLVHLSCLCISFSPLTFFFSPLSCHGKCVSLVVFCTNVTQACESLSSCPDVDLEDPEDEGRTDIVQVDIVPGKKPIKVPVLKKNGDYVGNVKVRTGTVPKGYVIRISTFEGALPEDEKSEYFFNLLFLFVLVFSSSSFSCSSSSHSFYPYFRKMWGRPRAEG
jgi:hypothetical protein